jgi:hypothetical protein
LIGALFDAALFHRSLSRRVWGRFIHFASA